VERVRLNGKKKRDKQGHEALATMWRPKKQRWEIVSETSEGKEIKQTKWGDGKADEPWIKRTASERGSNTSVGVGVVSRVLSRRQP